MLLAATIGIKVSWHPSVDGQSLKCRNVGVRCVDGNIEIEVMVLG
jgi:hypothetical protein